MTIQPGQPHARQGTLDQGELRRQNRRLVLEILLNHRATSRSELGSLTGLSASTVSLIVNDLVREGLVTESGKVESSRGRKPIVIQLCPQAATVIGIDLNELTGCVFDLESKPCMDFVNLPKGDEIQPADVVQLIETLLASIPEGIPAPSAIGISVPASVDPVSGDVLLSTNLDWSNVPLGRMVSGATGLPVTVETTRICLALSQIWSGVAQGANDFIYLHIGWRGIGAGVVMNGQVVRGARDHAGEMGHLQVLPDGPPCHCGKRGCLETVASGRAIAEQVRKRRSALGIQADALHSFADLAEAVRQNDNICRDVMVEAGERLADALAAAVTLADPELIVIGGSSMAASDLLLPIIQEVITRKTLHRPDIIAARDTQMKSAAGVATITSRSLLLEANGQSVGGLG